MLPFNLKAKINFFKFLTIKLPKSDIYPHYILPEKFSRHDIMELWKIYAKKVKYRQIYKNLGIFIKIPFCQSKCFYCQCFSKIERNPLIIDRYVDYICKELESYASIMKGIKIDSLYFGGGTPSILTISQIRRIFNTFYNNFKLEVDSQINFEATPHSLDEEKIKVLKELGVNRLTLGVQSLDEKVLDINSRNLQTGKMVKEIVALIKKYKIDSLNIDLIGGLYGQSYQSFMDSLKKVIALNPEVLHIYPFSAAEETLFSKSGKKLSAKDLKLRRSMIEAGNKLILKSGYKEIKNDSYGKAEKGRNKQEADSAEVNASILALGDRALGHIFEELIYMVEESKGKKYAQGVKIDLEDEITKYLLNNLRNTINLDELFRVFPSYTLKDLKKKLGYLLLFKKIIWQGNNMISRIKSRREQLVYGKFLYKKSYLEKLFKFCKNEFDPNLDYSKKLDYLIDETQ